MNNDNERLRRLLGLPTESDQSPFGESKKDDQDKNLFEGISNSDINAYLKLMTQNPPEEDEND